MNKKLFSWKALAGLALLVAMGMTSCKNTTEVDPNDPYNTTKPVKPGTSTAGDADLTFTITNASGGDVVSLWNAWKKANADAAKELMKQSEITIGLDFSNYKLDGKVISLPQFVNTPNGSTINLIVKGFGEAKKALNFNLNNSSFAGSEVNIFLPAAEFDMVLDAQGTKTTLASEEGTTLKTFKGTASTTKKNALTIEEGVTVQGISMTGALAELGDNIEALLYTGAETLEEGKGIQVGSEKLYATNLIVTTNKASLAAEKTAFKKVVINEGIQLNVTGDKPQIETIEGLGSEDKPSIVDFAGDKNNFTNVKSISNAIISGTASDVKDMAIFENVVFKMDVNLYTTGAANTEFAGDVNVKVSDDIAAVTFTDVTFGVKSVLTMDGAVTVSGKNKYISMWQWDKSKENYTRVTTDDEDDLLDANKKASAKYVKVVQSLFTSMPADVKMIDGEFLFRYGKTVAGKTDLKVLTDAYDAALKAYRAEIASKGYSVANGATSTTLVPLQNAWEAINGIAKDQKLKDDKGKDIEVIFTAFKDAEIEEAIDDKATLTGLDKIKYDPAKAKDLASLQGYKRQYADELAFVAKVNTAISGCDWFEIYYAKEETNTPDAVILSFDDCSVGSKAMTVEKANDLIDTDGNNFASKKDIWFDVVIDDELLEWAGNSTVGYYLK